MAAKKNNKSQGSKPIALTNLPAISNMKSGKRKELEAIIKASDQGVIDLTELAQTNAEEFNKQMDELFKVQKNQLEQIIESVGIYGDADKALAKMRETLKKINANVSKSIGSKSDKPKKISVGAKVYSQLLKKQKELEAIYKQKQDDELKAIDGFVQDQEDKIAQAGLYELEEAINAMKNGASSSLLDSIKKDAGKANKKPDFRKVKSKLMTTLKEYKKEQEAFVKLVNEVSWMSESDMNDLEKWFASSMSIDDKDSVFGSLGKNLQDLLKSSSNKSIYNSQNKHKAALQKSMRTYKENLKQTREYMDKILYKEAEELMVPIDLATLNKTYGKYKQYTGKNIQERLSKKLKGNDRVDNEAIAQLSKHAQNEGSMKALYAALVNSINNNADYRTIGLKSGMYHNPKTHEVRFVMYDQKDADKGLYNDAQGRFDARKAPGFTHKFVGPNDLGEIRYSKNAGFDNTLMYARDAARDSYYITDTVNNAMEKIVSRFSVPGNIISSINDFSKKYNMSTSEAIGSIIKNTINDVVQRSEYLQSANAATKEEAQGQLGWAGNKSQGAMLLSSGRMVADDAIRDLFNNLIAHNPGFMKTFGDDRSSRQEQLSKDIYDLARTIATGTITNYDKLRESAINKTPYLTSDAKVWEKVVHLLAGETTATGAHTGLASLISHGTNYVSQSQRDAGVYLIGAGSESPVSYMGGDSSKHAAQGIVHGDSADEQFALSKFGTPHYITSAGLDNKYDYKSEHTALVKHLTEAQFNELLQEYFNANPNLSAAERYAMSTNMGLHENQQLIAADIMPALANRRSVELKESDNLMVSDLERLINRKSASIGRALGQSEREELITNIVASKLGLDASKLSLDFQSARSNNGFYTISGNEILDSDITRLNSDTGYRGISVALNQSFTDFLKSKIGNFDILRQKHELKQDEESGYLKGYIEHLLRSISPEEIIKALAGTVLGGALRANGSNLVLSPDGKNDQLNTIAAVREASSKIQSVFPADEYFSIVESIGRFNDYPYGNRQKLGWRVPEAAKLSIAGAEMSSGKDLSEMKDYVLAGLMPDENAKEYKDALALKERLQAKIAFEASHQGSLMANENENAIHIGRNANGLYDVNLVDALKRGYKTHFGADDFGPNGQILPSAFDNSIYKLIQENVHDYAMDNNIEPQEIKVIIDLQDQNGNGISLTNENGNVYSTTGVQYLDGLFTQTVDSTGNIIGYSRNNIEEAQDSLIHRLASAETDALALDSASKAVHSLQQEVFKTLTDKDSQLNESLDAIRPETAFGLVAVGQNKDIIDQYKKSDSASDLYFAEALDTGVMVSRDVAKSMLPADANALSGMWQYLFEGTNFSMPKWSKQAIAEEILNAMTPGTHEFEAVADKVAMTGRNIGIPAWMLRQPLIEGEDTKAVSLFVSPDSKTDNDHVAIGYSAALTNKTDFDLDHNVIKGFIDDLNPENANKTAEDFVTILQQAETQREYNAKVARGIADMMNAPGGKLYADPNVSILKDHSGDTAEDNIVSDIKTRLAQVLNPQNKSQTGLLSGANTGVRQLLASLGLNETGGGMESVLGQMIRTVFNVVEEEGISAKHVIDHIKLNIPDFDKLSKEDQTAVIDKSIVELMQNTQTKLSDMASQIFLRKGDGSYDIDKFFTDISDIALKDGDFSGIQILRTLQQLGVAGQNNTILDFFRQNGYSDDKVNEIASRLLWSDKNGHINFADEHYKGYDTSKIGTFSIDEMKAIFKYVQDRPGPNGQIVDFANTTGWKSANPGSPMYKHNISQTGVQEQKFFEKYGLYISQADALSNGLMNVAKTYQIIGDTVKDTTKAIDAENAAEKNKIITATNESGAIGILSGKYQDLTRSLKGVPYIGRTSSLSKDIADLHYPDSTLVRNALDEFVKQQDGITGNADWYKLPDKISANQKLIKKIESTFKKNPDAASVDINGTAYTASDLDALKQQILTDQQALSNLQKSFVNQNKLVNLETAQKAAMGLSAMGTGNISHASNQAVAAINELFLLMGKTTTVSNIKEVRDALTSFLADPNIKNNATYLRQIERAQGLVDEYDSESAMLKKFAAILGWDSGEGGGYQIDKGVANARTLQDVILGKDRRFLDYEGTIYGMNRKGKYSGHYDAIFTNDQESSIVDYKTRQKTYLQNADAYQVMMYNDARKQLQDILLGASKKENKGIDEILNDVFLKDTNGNYVDINKNSQYADQIERLRAFNKDGSINVQKTQELWNDLFTKDASGNITVKQLKGYVQVTGADGSVTIYSIPNLDDLGDPVIAEKIRNNQRLSKEENAYVKSRTNVVGAINAAGKISYQQIYDDTYSKPHKKGGAKRVKSGERAKTDAASLREYEQALANRDKLEAALEDTRRKEGLTTNTRELQSLREIENAQAVQLEQAQEILKTKEAGLDLTRKEVKEKKAEIDQQAEINKAARLAQVGGKNRGARNVWDMIAQGVQRRFQNFVDFNLVTRGIGMLERKMREVIQTSIQLNKVSTDIRIVTGQNKQRVDELMMSYSKLAKDIGSTTTEVAQSANTWLRQGYSISEANELIKTSTYLSKLGMIDMSTATKVLTSTLKGFKMEASESLSVVDKLTELDKNYAASAGEIGEALSRVASVAQSVNLDLDKTAAMITVIMDVTQQEAGAVGTSVRSVLSRYSNVKAGKFSTLTEDADEDVDALNDVERVLRSVGIQVRSSRMEMRSFDEVLGELADKWTQLSNVEQNAISTAMAGTRQRNAFQALMDNYTRYEEAVETSRNSEGTTLTKWQAQQESVAFSLAQLKTAWEELSQKIMNSDAIKFVYDLTRKLVEGLPFILSQVVAIISAINAYKIPNALKSMWSSLSFKGSTLYRSSKFGVDSAGVPRGGLLGKANGSSQVVSATERQTSVLGGKLDIIIGKIGAEGDEVDSELLLPVDEYSKKDLKKRKAELKQQWNNLKPEDRDVLTAMRNDPNRPADTLTGDKNNPRKWFDKNGNLTKAGQEEFAKRVKPGNAIATEYQQINDELARRKSAKIAKRNTRMLQATAAGLGAGVTGFMTSDSNKFGAAVKHFDPNSGLGRINDVKSNTEDMLVNGIANATATGLLTAIPGIGPMIGPLFGPVVGDVLGGLFKYWNHRDEIERKQRVEEAKKELEALSKYSSAIDNAVSSLITKDRRDLTNSDYQSLMTTADVAEALMGDADIGQKFVDQFEKNLKTLSASAITAASALNQLRVGKDTQAILASLKAAEIRVNADATYRASEYERAQVLEDLRKAEKDYVKYSNPNSYDYEKAKEAQNKVAANKRKLEKFDTDRDTSLLGAAFTEHMSYMGADERSVASMERLIYQLAEKWAQEEGVTTQIFDDNGNITQEAYAKLYGHIKQQEGFANIGNGSENKTLSQLFVGREILSRAAREALGADVSVGDLVAIASNDQRIDELKKIAVKLGYTEVENVNADPKTVEKLLNITRDTIHSMNASVVADYAHQLGLTTEQLNAMGDKLGWLTGGAIEKGVEGLKEAFSGWNSVLTDLTDNLTLTTDSMDSLIKKYPYLLLDKNGNINQKNIAGNLVDMMYGKNSAAAEAAAALYAKDFKESSERWELFRRTDSFQNVANNFKTNGISDDLIRVLQNSSSLSSFNSAYDYLAMEGVDQDLIDKFVSAFAEQMSEAMGDLGLGDELQKIMNELMVHAYDLEIKNLESIKEHLSESNNQLDNVTKIIQAREKLENAINEKRRVYREGIGFTYESDQKAINEAQEELDQLEQEQEKQNIQYQIDLLQQQRDAIQNLAENEKWESVLQIYDKLAEQAGFVAQMGGSIDTLSDGLTGTDGLKSSLSKLSEAAANGFGLGSAASLAQAFADSTKAIPVKVEQNINNTSNVTDEERISKVKTAIDSAKTYEKAVKNLNATLDESKVSGNLRNVTSKMTSVEQARTNGANSLVSTLQALTSYVKSDLPEELQQYFNFDAKGKNLGIKDSYMTETKLGGKTASEYTAMLDSGPLNTASNDGNLDYKKYHTGEGAHYWGEYHSAINSNGVFNNLDDIYVYNVNDPKQIDHLGVRNSNLVKDDIDVNTHGEYFHSDQYVFYVKDFDKWYRWDDSDQKLHVLDYHKKPDGNQMPSDLYNYLQGTSPLWNVVFADVEHAASNELLALGITATPSNSSSGRPVGGKGGPQLYDLAYAAEGSYNTSNGHYFINELGTEGIITPQGTLTALPSHSGIVPADLTRNLYTLGAIAPTLIKRWSDPNNVKLNKQNSVEDNSMNVQNLYATFETDDGFDFEQLLIQARQYVANTKRNHT